MEMMQEIKTHTVTFDTCSQIILPQNPIEYIKKKKNRYWHIQALWVGKERKRHEGKHADYVSECFLTLGASPDRKEKHIFRKVVQKT